MYIICISKGSNKKSVAINVTSRTRYHPKVCRLTNTVQNIGSNAQHKYTTQSSKYTVYRPQSQTKVYN